MINHIIEQLQATHDDFEEDIGTDNNDFATGVQFSIRLFIIYLERYRKIIVIRSFLIFTLGVILGIILMII